MQRQHNPKASRIPNAVKLPKRKLVTLNDLFARDDVNDLLATVDKHKADITDCVIIYLDKNRTYHWAVTKDTLESTAVWLLESTKHDLLHSDDD